ncbi:phage tail tape measure protein, partial [Mesorhizobium sp. M3A.F.Ca.ET.175.01.1.1]
MLSAIGGRGNLGDVGSQLNFAWKELQTSESGVLKRLLGTTDVRGATAAFGGFERPEGFSWANPEGAHNFLGRLSGAQDALSKFGSTASNATSAVGQLGGASSSALSSLVSSTGNAAGGLNALGSGAGKRS